MSEPCVTSALPPPALPIPPRSFRPSPFAALVDQAAGSERFLLLALPAPAMDPAALLRLGPEDGFAYLPPEGPQFAGLGVAARLDGQGPGRFAELREKAAQLASFCQPAAAGAALPAPLFFGGLAFAPGGADEPRWSGFGDASFVLPRWLYRRDGEEASLVLALHGSELDSPERRRAWLAALEARRDRLAGLPRLRGGAGVGLRLHGADEAGLAARIGRIGAEIAAGRVEKVVTAQRFRAELNAELDPLQAFRRLVLGAAGSEATPFLFRRGGNVFFGATPELLIARRGLEVRSEALAGSSPRGRSPFELEDGGKTHHEHSVVTAAVLEALGPFCSRLEAGSTRARHLPRLSHLATPVAGRLKAPAHLLELAEALHPTPAVGGWPRPAALELLAEIETAPRGWYAGPVGYFDARGDGELRVALRSGLLAGREAVFYAGAGIVAGSQAAAEAAEIRTKTSTLVEALGGGLRRSGPVHLPFMSSDQDPSTRPAAPSGAALWGVPR